MLSDILRIIKNEIYLSLKPINYVFLSFVYLMYLFFVALIIFVLYRIVDGWVNKSLSVRKEQNDLLRELVEVIRERK